MKKCMFLLFGLMLGIAKMYAATADDIQGVWTLTTIEGDDTTQVLTPQQKLDNGAKYALAFPTGSTKLTISGGNYSLTYRGTDQWDGTFDLQDPNLTLTGLPSGCSDCEPKVIYFIIRSVSATELVLDRFDENDNTSTFAHFTFNK